MDYSTDDSGYQSSEDKRRNKGLKGRYGLNYARGENNGNSKLKDSDVVLMLDFRDSLQNDLDDIEKEIERLKERRLTIKHQMTRRYIGDMFEISTRQCERIFRGEQR